MIGLLMAAALLQTDAACNAAGAAPSPGCTAWRSLFRSDNAEVLADPASIRRTGSGFDLTVRILFASDQDGGMRSGVITYRFDCVGETGTMTHSRYYDAGGRLLADGATPGAPAIASPTGSPNRAVLDTYCRTG